MFNPKLTATETSDPKKILVTATGILGRTEMEIPLTLKQFKTCHKKYSAGAMVQNAFPMLNATQREFLVSGMTEEQQKQFFGE